VAEPITVITSGYFNPLHAGHVSFFDAAAALGDRLIVIVNNDVQQVRKKGRIIQTCEDRILVVSRLRMVDSVSASVDLDDSVRESLRQIRASCPDRLVFANGGDRSDLSACTELSVCRELDIECVSAVGGTAKLDSSSRINRALGLEPSP
jgi:cytidyltransferase-like protein